MLFGIIDVRKEPFRGLYIGFSNFWLKFVKVPYWTLRYLLPAWRPRRSWPLHWCIVVNTERYNEKLDHDVLDLLDFPDHRKLETGEGVNGLYVDAAPELIAGEVKQWADIAGVQPARIPGYWQHEPGSQHTMGAAPLPGEKVVYFLHGGGYVVLSAHPSSPTSGIARAVMKYAPHVSRTFAIEYRLSTGPPRPAANPFPAALIDAIAGYNYLVNTVGFKPSQIIVLGDSAGGNLALALTRYLVSNSGTVPNLPAPPSGLILLSPWVDLGHSHDHPDSSMFKLADSDFLLPPSDPSTESGPRAFVGPHGEAFRTHVYVSPASKTLEATEIFKGFPPAFISVGDAEIFLDQIRTLKERMIRDLGDKVAYLESKDAWHDFIGFPFFEPQRSEALTAIAKWTESL